MEALEAMCKCYEILLAVQATYDEIPEDMEKAIKKLETDICNIILSSHLEISH